MVYLYYISCLRYIILVGNPQYEGRVVGGSEGGGGGGGEEDCQSLRLCPTFVT